MCTLRILLLVTMVRGEPARCSTQHVCSTTFCAQHRGLCASACALACARHYALHQHNTMGACHAACMRVCCLGLCNTRNCPHNSPSACM
jgi:hypothetical protein